MVDVDDGNNDLARSGNVSTDEEEGGQTAVSTEIGFVSLATRESISSTADLHVTSEGILFEVGEQYSLCFRGIHLNWWKWGTLEVRQIAVVLGWPLMMLT